MYPMIKIVLKACLSFFVIAGLSGCPEDNNNTSSNGFSCPFFTPSCCYDSLFGCGFFDLPSGCTCSRYGFFAKETISGMQFVKAAQKTSPKSYGGTWSGTLRKGSSNCSAVPSRLNGYVRISDSNSGVKVTIPGYTTLKGKAKKRNGFTASSKYSSSRFACKANLSTNFSSSSTSRGVLQASMKYMCGSRVACTSNYRGTITKIR